MESPVLDMSLVMPHKGHEEHACLLANLGLFAKLKERARDPQFICGKCGRVASSAAYLCQPEKL